jgi:hypothetical protein
MLMMLGWIFAPIYIDLGIFTMPEFLKKRYGGERLKLFITLLSLGLYAFTKVSQLKPVTVLVTATAAVLVVCTTALIGEQCGGYRWAHLLCHSCSRGTVMYRRGTELWLSFITFSQR